MQDLGFRDAASGFCSAYLSSLSNLEFKVLGLGLEKAQYPLITEYTLNCRGLNIMI